MQISPHVIQTARLILRPFTVDDAAAYWPLVWLPEVIRYTGEERVMSIDAARQTLIDRPLRDYEVYGFGRMACIEKSTKRLIGFSGLKYLEELEEVDVGYRFLPDTWGNGYATESAKALMEMGTKEHGIRRYIGLVLPENQASANVLDKLGLAYVHRIHLADNPKELSFYASPGTTGEDAYVPTPRA